jgi:hypothetical protein
MASTFIAKHPRNIPASYHKPIGQLIVRWNFAELYMQSIIWHIWGIKDPKVARLLTWDLGAESKGTKLRMEFGVTGRENKTRYG